MNLSRHYTNEQIRFNTRARRRIARKLWKTQPLFAYQILNNALSDYSHEEFSRDIRPTKGSRKGKKKFSYKKEWIKQQFAKLETLTPRQINTLIDQMYNGPYWRIETRTTQGRIILSLRPTIPSTKLTEFVNWLNQSRRTPEEIRLYTDRL